MEKYYTPEIEEFYVGFEFEYRPRESNGIMAYIENRNTYAEGFIKESFKREISNIEALNLYSHIRPTTLSDIKQFIEDKAIRVEYLRGKGMSELGIKLQKSWVPTAQKNIRYRIYGLIDENNSRGVHYFIYHTISRHMLITLEDQTVFAGEIKNKSELKKVLKMIGV